MLWKQEGVLGKQFSVLQGDHSKARLVLYRIDHFTFLFVCLFVTQVLWRQEGVLGEQLSVVQGDHSKARFVLLKAGHSILGGRYTLPSYFSNQSIYDVFYIHEGAR